MNVKNQNLKRGINTVLNMERKGGKGELQQKGAVYFIKQTEAYKAYKHFVEILKQLWHQSGS